MKKQIKIILVLLAFACVAIPVIRGTKGDYPQPINAMKSDISQAPFNQGEESTIRLPEITIPILEVTPNPTQNPTPTPTQIIKKPLVPSVVWTKEQSSARIREVFGSKGEEAIKIATCESGLRSNAIGDKNLNPSSYGLFQIRGFSNRGTTEQLLNPEYNIQKAYQISGGGGSWKAWSCAKIVGLK